MYWSLFCQKTLTTSDKTKINWQFSVEAARSKLNSHYVKVLSDNKKFKDIYGRDAERVG